MINLELLLNGQLKHCPVHKSLNSEIILNFIYN